ncbi:MAG: hypothetical protein ACYTG2_10085 [Planctomycetota bacterium]
MQNDTGLRRGSEGSGIEVDEAVSRISEIHAQLLKSELFRGYRSWPMATTGVIGLVAALVQSTIWTPASGTAFVVFWLVIASICVSICLADLAYGYLQATSSTDRGRTRSAVSQFLPPLVAGAIATACLIDAAPQLLPGLWALFYSLGLFSSRLHLPRAVGWVGMWYLASGTALLWGAADVGSPWGMGLCFGVGQLALAWVFQTPVERGSHDVSP